MFSAPEPSPSASAFGLPGGGPDADGAWHAIQPRDLPRVLRLEQQSYSHPWTLGQFEDSLRQGHAAWGCWTLQSEHPDASLCAYWWAQWVLDEAHLLNITVAPDHRRRGLGQATLCHFLHNARQRHCTRALLEVRSSNVAALGLYRRNGFSLIGTRKGYYPAGHGREDALVMACPLLP